MHGSVCNQVMDKALFASAVQIHVSGVLSGRHKDIKHAAIEVATISICNLVTANREYLNHLELYR